MDEEKTVKAIQGTVVGSRTRLLTVEYKQVRGGLLIVSEIRETLRVFRRLVTERDMLHEKD